MCAAAACLVARGAEGFVNGQGGAVAHDVLLAVGEASHALAFDLRRVHASFYNGNAVVSRRNAGARRTTYEPSGALTLARKMGPWHTPPMILPAAYLGKRSCVTQIHVQEDGIRTLRLPREQHQHSEGSPT